MKHKPAHIDTLAGEMVMEWDHGSFKKTIPIDRHTNVATMCLAPGFTSYEAFVQEGQFQNKDFDPVVMDTNIVSDDESSVSLNLDYPDADDDWSVAR